jgi:hypothetical protein
MAWLTFAGGLLGWLPLRATPAVEPAAKHARAFGAARRQAWCALLLLPACTDFAPSSDIETVTQSALAGDWACLESAAAPTPTDATTAPRAVRSLRIQGFVDGNEMGTATVRACTLRDPDCLAPVSPSMRANAEGWVDVPLYAGFDGYLEITGPGAVPAMLFYSAPLAADTAVDSEPAFLVDMETALSFDRLFLGRDAFPSTGVITVRALNCANAPASGVQFRLEPAAVGWYYVGDIPVATAQATTESGVGGFSDVRPGTMVVSAELTESGRQLAPPRSVFVRSGWFTNIRFRR